MLGSILVGLLLAYATIPLEAHGQAPATPAVTAPAQDPAEKDWPPAGVLALDKTLKAPEVITEIKPRYTDNAMRQRIQGLVEMEAVVLADGAVGPVRVVKSLDKDFGLDEQAVRAMKQWRFRPGQKDGVPVPVLVKIQMTFTLRDKK